MNCTKATEILDRMIFEEVPADAALRQHLESCPSCSLAFRDALKAREVLDLVRRSGPVPDNPGELTENILAAIEKQPRKTRMVPLLLLHLLLPRLLAAASVALFLLLGYEQYGVVSKVSALEVQFAENRPASRYIHPRRPASTLYLSQAGISFAELQRFLAAHKGTSRLSVTLYKQLEKRNKP